MTGDVIAISLFISLIFSITPIVHKHIFNTVTMNPQTLIVSGAILYFSCTMVYFAFNRKEVLAPLATLKPSIYLLMIATGALSFYANYLYFNVISKHESYLVSALIFSSPFFTLILAYFFLKEDISLMSAFGVALIVGGVLILALSKKQPIKPFSTIKGD